MATFRTCQCHDGVKVLTVMNEDERALKDALENFNTQKSTSTGFYQVFCRNILKNINLSQNLSSNLFTSCVEFSFETITISKNHYCERNLSPMILIGNQVALGIISLAFYPNSRPFLVGQVDY